MRKTLIILFLILIFSWQGICAQTAIMNLTDAKKAVTEYYTSGKWEADVEYEIDRVSPYFTKMEFAKNDAVVFDIDETVLNNFEGIKSVDYGFEMNHWIKWINSLKAPAIKPVKRLYDLLVSKKVHIIFLTGRSVSDIEATKKNLEKEGFGVYSELILRDTPYDSESMAVFKARKRGELVKKGYSIFACVGDQDSDMAIDNFGYKVKIPNLMYFTK